MNKLWLKSKKRNKYETFSSCRCPHKDKSLCAKYFANR